MNENNSVAARFEVSVSTFNDILPYYFSWIGLDWTDQADKPKKQENGATRGEPRDIPT